MRGGGGFGRRGGPQRGRPLFPRWRRPWGRPGCFGLIVPVIAAGMVVLVGLGRILSQ